jgi:hypothetical protein
MALEAGDFSLASTVEPGQAVEGGIKSSKGGDSRLIDFILLRVEGSMNVIPNLIA